MQQKFSLPWCPGCSDSPRKQPDSSLMAADSLQAQLPSSTARLPVAWLPGTPCLPNTSGRGGRLTEEPGASPSSHSISFFRSESLGIGIWAVSPERFCWKSRCLSQSLLRDLLVQRGKLAAFVFVLLFSLGGGGGELVANIKTGIDCTQKSDFWLLLKNAKIWLSQS